MRILMVMCGLLVACGTSPSGSGSASASGSATASGSAAATGAASASAAGSAPDPVSDACTTADDCAIGCFADESDCCGDACGCEHPYTRERLTKLQAERHAICSRKDVDCPKVRCVTRSYWPACENGRCIAVPAPAKATCTSDADCTTSTAVAGSCCLACDASVWARKELDAYHAWAKAHCAAADCPRRTCPAGTPVKARCANGGCVIARP